MRKIILLFVLFLFFIGGCSYRSEYFECQEKYAIQEKEYQKLEIQIREMGELNLYLQQKNQILEIDIKRLAIEKEILINMLANEKIKREIKKLRNSVVDQNKKKSNP